MSEPTLHLLQSSEAETFLYELIFNIDSTAFLFKASLKAFVAGLYRSGYLVIEASPESRAKLDVPFTGERPIIVGGIHLFSPAYAEAFLLHQAQEAKLPVAAIKPQLVKLVEKSYALNYIFGAGIDAEVSAKITLLLNTAKGKVILVMKDPKQETHDAPSLPTDPASNGPAPEPAVAEDFAPSSPPSCPSGGDSPGADPAVLASGAGSVDPQSCASVGF